MKVDKEKCIGCQCCVAMKSDNMIMGEDGKAEIIKQPETEEEKTELVNSCPVGAIEGE